jgi:hypothetical protein
LHCGSIRIPASFEPGRFQEINMQAVAQLSPSRAILAQSMLVGVGAANGAPPPEAATASIAYGAYLKAVKSGDFDAVMDALTPERVMEFRAQRRDANFPAFWHLFTEAQPSAVKVTAAHKDGEKLYLTVEVTRGERGVGTIEMRRLRCKWLVGCESYKS